MKRMKKLATALLLLNLAACASSGAWVPLGNQTHEQFRKDRYRCQVDAKTAFPIGHHDMAIAIFNAGEQKNMIAECMEIAGYYFDLNALPDTGRGRVQQKAQPTRAPAEKSQSNSETAATPAPDHTPALKWVVKRGVN
jgi:hypothetical protein